MIRLFIIYLSFLCLLLALSSCRILKKHVEDIKINKTEHKDSSANSSTITTKENSYIEWANDTVITDADTLEGIAGVIEEDTIQSDNQIITIKPIGNNKIKIKAIAKPKEVPVKVLKQGNSRETVITKTDVHIKQDSTIKQHIRTKDKQVKVVPFWVYLAAGLIVLLLLGWIFIQFIKPKI